MKAIYNIIEFTLIVGLILFGRIFNTTTNIWLIFAMVIIAHLTLEFLFKLRSYIIRRNRRNAKRNSTWNNLSVEGRRALENSRITHRDFYDVMKGR